MLEHNKTAGEPQHDYDRSRDELTREIEKERKEEEEEDGGTRRKRSRSMRCGRGKRYGPEGRNERLVAGRIRRPKMEVATGGMHEQGGMRLAPTPSESYTQLLALVPALRALRSPVALVVRIQKESVR